MATRTNQTIVRNTSGVDDMFFSFLGEHGMTIDDGEDVAINGGLWDRYMNDPIQSNAIRTALANGYIEILKTQDVLVNDTATYRVYKLGTTSGSFAALNPDYGSYSGGGEPNPSNDP